MRENRTRFSGCKHHGKLRRTANPLDVIDEIELSFEYLLIQKKKRSERLILRGCSNMFLHGQVGQELRDLAFAHLIWMSFVVEKDEAAYPFNVSLLGADRIMFYPQMPADAVE